MNKPVKWAVGVTTCLERLDTTLQSTLRSLERAGFYEPRVSYDGVHEDQLHKIGSVHDVTLRFPKVGAYGNWILSLMELFVRDPRAHRYAMFQDDVQAPRNLRQYLDTIRLGEKEYWNLFTAPNNHLTLTERGDVVGFHRSNQLGRGALGLVFGRETVIELLSNRHMASKPAAARMPTTNIDGAVVQALVISGSHVELVHRPSLLQHTGHKSTLTMHKGGMEVPHDLADAPEFAGESFDCLEWAKKGHISQVG